MLKICEYCNEKFSQSRLVNHKKLCQIYSNFYCASSLKQYQCLICNLEIKSKKFKNKLRSQMCDHLRTEHPNEIKVNVFQEQYFGIK